MNEPYNGDENSFNILCSDPSSNYVGIAILNINSNTMEINNIDTMLFNLNVVKHEVLNYDAVTHRIRLLEKLFARLVRAYNPIILAFERGFHNPRTPGSFAPLLMSTTTMVNTTLRFNPMVHIEAFSPGEVKNAMGQKGNCKKDVMKKACLESPIINKYVDANAITEHEIDACAVGLCALNHYKRVKITLL